MKTITDEWTKFITRNPASPVEKEMMRAAWFGGAGVAAVNIKEGKIKPEDVIDEVFQTACAALLD